MHIVTDVCEDEVGKEVPKFSLLSIVWALGHRWRW